MQKVTIPSGASKSELLNTQGRGLVGIFMPAAWTAADIGYEANWDGNPNDMFVVYSAGAQVQTVAVGASQYIAFPMSSVSFVPFIKITSVAAGTATPANQGAAREILLVFRNFLS
jgi:hypothetical protein